MWPAYTDILGNCKGWIVLGGVVWCLVRLNTFQPTMPNGKMKHISS